jgi:predicted nucleic acid-binding protein
MTTYVDANALVRYYLNMPGREHLVATLSDPAVTEAWPVPVTDLVRFEVSNALERMVFESRHGGMVSITPEMVMVAHTDFEADMARKRLFLQVPITLADIETEFTSLMRRHTAKNGFRTYDILHVASALKLRCKRFLSFDTKANALAKLAGLETI